MIDCVLGLVQLVASCGVLWIVFRWRQSRYQRMEQEIFGEVGGYRNKWERMTGQPCQPPGREGLPTSPPAPRRVLR